MKIAICGSLDFTYEMKNIADQLEVMGLVVEIPISSRRILAGEFTLNEIKKEKKLGKASERKIKYDAIRKYYQIIKENDAVLVANYDKKGIKNYIGGNSFLEMGFAHILNKKIYLLHDIPEMIYSDEIKTMQPIVLNGDLKKV